MNGAHIVPPPLPVCFGRTPVADSTFQSTEAMGAQKSGITARPSNYHSASAASRRSPAASQKTAASEVRVPLTTSLRVGPQLSPSHVTSASCSRSRGHVTRRVAVRRSAVTQRRRAAPHNEAGSILQAAAWAGPPPTEPHHTDGYTVIGSVWPRRPAAEEGRVGRAVLGGGRVWSGPTAARPPLSGPVTDSPNSQQHSPVRPAWSRRMHPSVPRTHYHLPTRDISTSLRVTKRQNACHRILTEN